METPGTFGLLEHGTRRSILEVDGTLRTPLSSGLSQRVRALLDQGEQRILLDLSRLSDIDAAGVGELVAVFNVTAACGGVLQIAHARRRVRQLLQVAGVFALLTGSMEGNPAVTPGPGTGYYSPVVRTHESEAADSS